MSDSSAEHKFDALTESLFDAKTESEFQTAHERFAQLYNQNYFPQPANDEQFKIMRDNRVAIGRVYFNWLDMFSPGPKSNADFDKFALSQEEFEERLKHFSDALSGISHDNAVFAAVIRQIFSDAALNTHQNIAQLLSDKAEQITYAVGGATTPSFEDSQFPAPTN